MGKRIGWFGLVLALVLPGLASAQSAVTPTATLVTATSVTDGRVNIPSDQDDPQNAGYEANKADLKTPVKTSQVKQALTDLDEKKDANADQPSVGSLDDNPSTTPDLDAPVKGAGVQQALSALDGDQLGAPQPQPSATPTAVTYRP